MGYNVFKISLSKCSLRPSLFWEDLLVKKKEKSSFKSNEILYLIKQLHIFIINLKSARIEREEKGDLLNVVNMEHFPS